MQKLGLHSNDTHLYVLLRCDCYLCLSIFADVELRAYLILGVSVQRYTWMWMCVLTVTTFLYLILSLFPREGRTEGCGLSGRSVVS